MKPQDSIDRWNDQWAWADMDLPLASVAVAKRIGRIARELEGLSAATLAPLGLDPGEFDVLASLLRAGPPHELTPTVLNQSLMMSAGGLTKRLTRLEQRGLVSRRLDEADRRSLLVAATPSGLHLAQEAVLTHSRVTAAAVDRIGGPARDELSRLLRRLLLQFEAPSAAGAAEQEAGERREERAVSGGRRQRRPPVGQRVD